jgi:hypothetical protein
MNETYSGLKNYGNSCYINSFLAVVAGMNGGSEKQLLLAELQKNGIKFSDNKFSSINEGAEIQGLIDTLRINQDENQIVIAETNNVAVSSNNENKTEQIKTREKPKIFDPIKNGEIEKVTKSIPKHEIQPTFFSRIYDFFANLDSFSCCRGN